MAINRGPLNVVIKTKRYLVSLKRRLRRLLDNLQLVHPPTLVSLRLNSALSRKIRVGFGPIKTGEDDLNVRKWRIDPIVAQINRQSSEYVADLFFEGDRLDRFDVIVVVKVYGDELVQELLRLSPKRLIIFDVVDNPLGCKRSIYDDEEFASVVDGLILSSPRQQALLAKYELAWKLIEHPVINPVYKTDYSVQGDTTRILWQGFRHNSGGVRGLEELVDDVAADTGRPIKLIYHTNAPASDEGRVAYVPWAVENAFSTLVEADIAITARDNVRSWQEEKPSTKVILYMGAGLPLVCTPTEADKLVVRHGLTGYFASDRAEWREYLGRLVRSQALREQIGNAARHHAIENYSIPRITEKYLAFFTEIRNAQARVNSSGI